jgi:serine/threonine protein kinase
LNSHWTQITESEFPWEREALAFLKQRLPDHDPYRAWANFEFLLDGTIGEVDALVVAPKGIFLIEIKSWPGRLEGDAGTWRNTRPGDTRVRTMDNPLLLTNRKAKRLKSLLARQKALRGERRLPFITPLVFLSHTDLDCRLPPEARDGIHGIDGDKDKGEPSPQRGGLTGIVEALTRISPEEHERLGNRRIDKPTSTKIAAALEQAGIRPSQARRQVGDLRLGELLEDGPGYQDFEATHPRFERAHRRVRIYGTPDMASDEQRKQAARAAQREFELLTPISHPGIVSALAFHEHELGPAIAFERDPTEITLDHHLDHAGETLNLLDRLALVRDLAETVAYAHGRRLFHRALSPRSVLVLRPGTPEQRFSIVNWQTGARASGETLSTTVEGTRHPEQLVEECSAAYLAPEALTQPGADPELLDVFSLGAIAFHVFTGSPPASTLAGLAEILERDGGLEVASRLDGAGPNLTELIRMTTAADAGRRVASVDDFLALLDTVEEELTAPPEQTDEGVTPEKASKDDLLAGFVVERRLGRGSTAIAFLVRDSESQQRVLKVASDPDRNERVRDEGEVLAKLRDRTIVASYGEPLDVAGHTAILLAYASEGTLLGWLRREGRLGLETLERWGQDLLSALSYLEQVGIPHRDIKPENLGIMELGPRKKRQLVLMDFSLARAPAQQLHAGTPPYLDPFLGTGQRKRWDLAADRFSAAMVLHEMAAGAPPKWADGRSDPRFVDSEVSVDRDALPREIAGPLGAFFEHALRRDAAKRFDTADDMLRAWRRVFAELEKPETADESDRASTAAQRATATFETPLVAIGLTARATNALERVNALTVGDLLTLPRIEINSLRGVGLKTRRELVAAHQELQGRLGRPDRASPTSRASVTTNEPDVQPLDALTGQLVPKRSARNATEVDAIRLLLALDLEGPAPGEWPSQTEVATGLDVTRARVGQVLAKARERWARLPAVTRLRAELREHVERLGGIATAAELERAVGADRGASAEEGLPVFARAAVRAAVETELAGEAPCLTQRRTGARVLLASAGETAEQRQRALEYAVRLGTMADGLSAADPLPGPTDVVERLRALAAPPGIGLSQERLVQLAAAASATAAVSARLELHPREMPASRALGLGRAALLGAETLSSEEIQRRIAARFPEAEPLPARPRLDELLAAAGIELRFDEQENAFRAPARELLTGISTSFASPLHRLATANVPRLPPRADPEVLEAQEFERRLEASAHDGGLLTLMAFPSDVAAAAAELRRFAPTAIDLDRLLIERLHTVADELKVRWDLVLRADGADRSSQDWSRLTTLVARALPQIEEELVATEGTVLLENAGLLARYGQLGLVDRLRAAAASPSHPLRGCWLLISADEQSHMPVLDGAAVPALTPNEWARVPRSWLKNVHRGLEPVEEGAA